MNTLFSPIKLGELEVRNRVVMAPMCVYCATDGLANDFHINHYAARALGGVGLIIIEATGVEDIGRITDNCLGLWRDDQAEALAKVVQQIKGNGAAAGIQLGHSGRKCEVTGAEIIAPSALSFSGDYKNPKEMTKDDINRVIEAFGSAAKRAKDIGIDFVEIHSAHGYLLSTFLSPLTNTREDEYGSSSNENRARFLCEVIKTVKENFDGAVGVRFSATDFAKGGNKPEDIAKIIDIIKPLGVDIVNISAGGLVADQKGDYYFGYQIPFAEEIKKATDIKTIAGGLIKTVEQANEIVQNNRADMVFIGRALLREPFWALNAAKALNAEVEYPKPYKVVF